MRRLRDDLDHQKAQHKVAVERAADVEASLVSARDEAKGLRKALDGTRHGSGAVASHAAAALASLQALAAAAANMQAALGGTSHHHHGGQ